MRLYKGHIEDVLEVDFYPDRDGMYRLLDVFQRGYVELDDPWVEFEDYIMEQIDTEMIMLFLDYVDEDDFISIWELEYDEACRVTEDEYDGLNVEESARRQFRRKWHLFLVLTSL